jgi:hypothetical protein
LLLSKNTSRDIRIISGDSEQKMAKCCFSIEKLISNDTPKYRIEELHTMVILSTG